MVKQLVAAALFAATTSAVSLNRIVYNQYEADAEEPETKDILAQYEADEEKEDHRTFGEDEELAMVNDDKMLQINEVRMTSPTPIATPQNPEYSNELPFKAISRARVPYDRSQAFSYHDGNGYENSQHDGRWKYEEALAQTSPTPIATPQNPEYSNELPFRAISRWRGNYDRSQAFSYHDGNGYENSQHDGRWKYEEALAQTSPTPIATPQNPEYSNELPFRAISRWRGNYDRAQAFKYHDGNGYENSQHDGRWKYEEALAQTSPTPIATPQNPEYSNELPFKAISRARVPYDRSQAFSYHDGNGYENSQHDGRWKYEEALAQTSPTPIATPQNPEYSNELPFRAISRWRGNYDRSQAFSYHDGNGYENSQHDGRWKYEEA